jgi:multiple sugar transport system substrate-binding protein
MHSWIQGIGLVLAIASIATWYSLPQQQAKVPVLYWVTDPNPARDEQIAEFYRWLAANDYPPMEVRVDAANTEITKKLIQGVSGVAGDIIDSYRAKRDLLLFHNVGMLADVTDHAEQLGFGPDRTYPAMRNALFINGRQYGFPRNVATFQFWVNQTTFDELGLPPPPAQWDFATFERHGREFVARANAAGGRQARFFAMPDQTDPVALPLVMLRSVGITIFNETMTACVLDDPRTIQVLEQMHRWTYQYKILPSAGDRAAMTSAAGFGGSALQLFREGRVGMVMMGRYALLQFRRFDEPLRLAVSELPAERFRNTLIMGAVPAVYAGSGQQDLAVYFLAYLASEAYNLQIVRDADGLPPNPAYTTTEAFLRPPNYPNEWGAHAAFARAALELAVPYDYNEFILPAMVSRLLERSYEAFMNNLIDAPEAARRMQRDLNAEIARNLAQRPRLADVHAGRLRQQAAIDDLKARGLPIPASLIENPFHLAYYRSIGWLSPEP